MKRAVVAIALALSLSSLAWAATFFEDFSVDLSHWTNIAGSFTISGSGRLNAVALISHNAMYHNTPVAADQWIQWKVMTVAGTDNGFAGFVRANSNYDGYQCFSFTLTGSEEVTIYEVTGGSFALLASGGSFTWTPGDVGYCEVVGSTITFKVNGNTKVTQADSTYTTGSVGLEMYSQASYSVEIDDVTGGDFATTGVRHRPIIQ